MGYKLKAFWRWVVAGRKLQNTFDIESLRQGDKTTKIVMTNTQFRILELFWLLVCLSGAAIILEGVIYAYGNFLFYCYDLHKVNVSVNPSTECWVHYHKGSAMIGFFVGIFTQAIVETFLGGPGLPGWTGLTLGSLHFACWSYYISQCTMGYYDPD